MLESENFMLGFGKRKKKTTTDQSNTLSGLFKKSRGDKNKPVTQENIDDYQEALANIVGQTDNPGDEAVADKLDVDDLDVDDLDVDDLVDDELPEGEEPIDDDLLADDDDLDLGSTDDVDLEESLDDTDVPTVKASQLNDRKRKIAKLDINNVNLDVGDDSKKKSFEKLADTESEDNDLLGTMNLSDASLLVANFVDDEPVDEPDDLEDSLPIGADDDSILASDDVADDEFEAVDEEELDEYIEPESEIDDSLEADDAEPEKESSTPEPQPMITRDQAIDALSPVQQAILRNMDKLDLNQMKTVAQMSEANLYMQSLVMDWSNAYDRQMKHLQEWQDYADKLRNMMIKVNDQHDDEIAKMQHRHQVQLKNVRTALEEDYKEREAKLAKDQELARQMVEQAQALLTEAQNEKEVSRTTISDLEKQINVMSTRPENVDLSNVTPIAPSLDSLDDQATLDALGMKSSPNLDEMFKDDNWG